MANAIDVSFETPDYSGMEVSPGASSQRKMKRVFPTLTIPNNPGLAKSLTAGQEFTATVRFRVAEVMIRERADGGDPTKYDYPGDGVRVELEVQSMAPQGVAIEDDGDENDGETAIKNFFGQKGSKTAKPRRLTFD